MQILFKGLVAFVRYDTPNKPQRFVAVLMSYQAHESVLSVKTGDVDMSETSLQGSTSGNLSCFPLSGRITTSLGTGLPATDTASAEIPRTKLGFPGGKTVHTSVKMGTPNLQRFFAVFDLPPGGTFAVHEYVKDQATFDGDKTHACIPVSVSYDVAATAPVTFYVGVDTVVVGPSATVSITNLDVNMTGNHYPAFAQLFNENTTINVPTKSATPCSKLTGKKVPNCTTGADLDITCSPVGIP
jgi:hypothetical protein